MRVWRDDEMEMKMKPFGESDEMEMDGGDAADSSCLFTLSTISISTDYGVCNLNLL